MKITSLILIGLLAASLTSCSIYKIKDRSVTECQVIGKVLNVEETRIKRHEFSTDEFINVRMDVEMLTDSPDRDQYDACRKFKQKRVVPLQALRLENFVNPLVKLKKDDIIRGKVLVSEQLSDKIDQLEIVK